MDAALRPTGVKPVRLSTLVADVDVLGATDSATLVSGITVDSRAVQPGWLYVALPGTRSHGARFGAEARDSGAVAILTDEAGSALVGEVEIPVVVAQHPRRVMAQVAARLFGNPAETLTMLGVTGTNGKTTTVALLQAGLMASGRLSGTIGTIGFRLGTDELRSSRSTVTTPESPDLQALLAVMKQRGAEAVALEVSSHALALDRVDAIEFDVAGFLNLGRDHLDFHSDLNEYFEAKARLFEPGRARVAVIWIDDDHGRQLAHRIRDEGSSRLVTVGRCAEADYQLGEYRSVSPLGGAATITRGGERLALELTLPGEYNMVDAVVALAMLEAVDVPADAAIAGLRQAQIPGRMQRVELGDDAPLVVVDFAHTPQAVSAALSSLAGQGQLITVIGCGGDRDPEKRFEMGASAARLSDVTIITDDNPRTEDPAKIRAQTLVGARSVQRKGAEVLEVGDRRRAIETALRRARAGTVVAILGKGHERGQILADRTVEFDDVGEAARAWRESREEGASDADTHDG